MNKLRALRFIEWKEIEVEKIIFVIILFTNIGIVFMCLNQGMMGNDYWWHVKTGEWIVCNGRIPNKDIFSWIGINLNIDWVPHEWLSDIVFYSVYSLGGHPAVYIFVLLLAIGYIIIVHFIAGKWFKANVLFVSCFLVFLTIIVTSVFYPRPQIFSYYILLFVIWCLYQFIDHKKDKYLYFIPAITIIWSNLHGGFAMLSYVLCFCLLIVSFLPKRGRLIALSLTKKERIRVLVVSVLSVLAILVNPIGIKVLLYPFVNQGDKLMMSVISEWRAPDCKRVGELLLYFIPIFFSIVSFVYSRKRIRIIDFVLFILFVFLFFRSVRFILLWYSIMLFSGLRYVPIIRIKQVKNHFERFVIFCVSVSSVVFLFYGIFGSFAIIDSTNAIKREISNQMIQYIKNDVSVKRFYNDYDYGGELIFHDIPVFFDSRADLFASQSIMKDGLEMLYLVPFGNDSNVEICELLKKYKIERILVKKNRALYTYLSSNQQEYLLKYCDENSAYFECKRYE